jgi:hypothetical protein
VTIAAVERHITGIFAKLNLSPNSTDHRRVVVALRYHSCRSTGAKNSATGIKSANPLERQQARNGDAGATHSPVFS